MSATRRSAAAAEANIVPTTRQRQQIKSRCNLIAASMSVTPPGAMAVLGALSRRLAALRHGDVDDVGEYRRVVRYVGEIGEQQAQLVLADRERDLRFGLAGAEVQVVEVVRDRLV